MEKANGRSANFSNKDIDLLSKLEEAKNMETTTKEGTRSCVPNISYSCN